MPYAMPSFHLEQTNSNRKARSSDKKLLVAASLVPRSLHPRRLFISNQPIHSTAAENPTSPKEFARAQKQFQENTADCSPRGSVRETRVQCSARSLLIFLGAGARRRIVLIGERSKVETWSLNYEKKNQRSGFIVWSSKVTHVVSLKFNSGNTSIRFWAAHRWTFETNWWMSDVWLWLDILIGQSLTGEKN